MLWYSSSENFARSFVAKEKATEGGRFSFSVELELYIAWCAYDAQGEALTLIPHGFGPVSGHQLIIPTTTHDTDKIIMQTLKLQIWSLLHGTTKGMVTPQQDGVNVVEERALKLPESLAARSGKNSGWIGLEIVSLALWANSDGFGQARQVCPGHPARRRNHPHYPSTGLYSNLSFGMKIVTHHRTGLFKLPTESVRALSPSFSDRTVLQELFKRYMASLPDHGTDERRAKDHFPPRPSIRAYNVDPRTTTSQTSGLILSAVAELNRSTNRTTLGEMMMVDGWRSAYNFNQFALGEKRTIEFRMPAATIDAVEVVSQARIAVALCRFAAEAEPDHLLKMIFNCESAEANPSWFDVYDLFLLIGLAPEAKVVHAVSTLTLSSDVKMEY
ncbi:hypothetical protein F4677DRAFT_454440 [Hypoxylon crocopeplum]|nr:hypothetical protein F4677DRAFT_454440 [Hypoxylon crocopeplum]